MKKYNPLLTIKKFGVYTVLPFVAQIILTALPSIQAEWLDMSIRSVAVGLLAGVLNWYKHR